MKLSPRGWFSVFMIPGLKSAICGLGMSLRMRNCLASGREFGYCSMEIT